MANFAMLDNVLGYIEAHPKEHNQAYFGLKNECGTTMCVAGHAVVMAGGELNWSDSIFTRDYVAQGAILDGIFYETTEAAGRAVLDLTEEQADELFYCMSNDINVLKGIVKEWANEQ